MIDREFWTFSLVHSKALAMVKGFIKFPRLKLNLVVCVCVHPYLKLQPEG